MPTLPSGMSVADAEALSKKQQQQIKSNVPKEGEVFRYKNDLYAIKNNELIGLNRLDFYNRPENKGVPDNEIMDRYRQQLGLSGLKEYNIADVVSVFGDVPGQGLGRQLSPDEFKKAISGLNKSSKKMAGQNNFVPRTPENISDPQDVSSPYSISTPSISIPKISDLTQPDSDDIYLGTLATPTFDKPTADSVAASYVGSLSYNVDASRAVLENKYDQEYNKFQSQIDNLTNELNAIQSGQQEALGGLQSALSNYTNQIRGLQSQQQRVTNLYNQQANSYDKIASIKASAESQIAAVEGTTGLKSILSPRISKIVADTSAQTGVIQAAISARGKDISAAKNALSAAEDVIEADRKASLDYYYQVKDFYKQSRDLASDFLKTAIKDQQKVVDKQIKLLEGDLERANEVYRMVEDAMLDPKTATMYEQAGITLYDNTYTINKKLSDWNYWEEIRTKENKLEEAGYERIINKNQLAGLGNEDVMRIVDSRGIERVYKKPLTTEEQKQETALLKAGVNVWEYGEKERLKQETFIFEENIERQTAAWEKLLGLEEDATIPNIPEIGTTQTQKTVTETPTNELGDYVPDTNYLKYYSENEIIRQPDGKIYLKKGVPKRWEQTKQPTSSKKSQLEVGRAYKFADSPKIYQWTGNKLKHIPNENVFQQIYGGLPEEGFNFITLSGKLNNYQ